MKLQIAITILFGLLIALTANADMTLMDEPNLQGTIVPITEPVLPTPLPPPPIPEWTLTAGDTIGHDLQIWADKAGWKVIWSMQKDWTVPASTIFSGEFPVVAGEVIKTLASNGALIHAQFYEGNKTMVVTGPGVSE